MSAGLIPSTKYIDLGAQSIANDSSKDYIAPENGFYQVTFDKDGNNFGAGNIANKTRNIVIEDNDITSNSSPYVSQRRLIPVLKGDIIRIYVAGKTVSNLRFIYAIGSEPKE